MPATLSLSDLPPEAREKALAVAGRKRAPKARSFTAEHERRFALKVCAMIAELSQAERARVLRKAIRINEA